MPSIRRALDYILHNRSQFMDSCVKNLGFLFPDKVYLSLRYRFIMGHTINWNNPKTFTEKLQWLKINDFKKEYKDIVDKFSVKKIVAEKIGAQYVIPTLNVYKSVDEIDWSELPSQFVLKTTHGGGGTGVVVCKDKQHLNISNAKSRLNDSMACVVGREFRERPYYDVERKIILEQYIEPVDGELNDYKFFCSNGKVICFKVDFDRFIEHHANYYDTSGNLLPFGELGLAPDYNHTIDLPKNLNEMLEVASKLSKGYRFIRVDLYNVGGKIYFGELTLYPGGGLVPFTSEEWDLYIGEQIEL